MIRYALVCEHDHGWDAWFDSIASFESQVERHLVECPVCGSTQVRRGVMAPAMVSPKRRQPAAAAVDLAPSATEEPGSLMTAPDGVSLPEPVRAFLNDMREHVRANYDYVGDAFSREARAMHEGETEARLIYGETTPQEARALVEDGVPVAPLPRLAVPPRPRDLN